MSTPLFPPTIEQAFGQFLHDQEGHCTRLVYDQYHDVLEFFRQFFEQDGWEFLSPELQKKWKEASAQGQTFLKTFHTPQIMPAVPAFMKDLAYQQSILPAGMLTNAEKCLHLLGRWLLAQEQTQERDYIAALEAFPHYAPQLEPADQLSSMLFDFARDQPPEGKVFESIKGFSEIKKVQKGALILLPLIENHLSPFVRVPPEASAIAKAGWWLDAHLIQTPNGWYFVDVGSVLP